jgi:hypothetical protein
MNTELYPTFSSFDFTINNLDYNIFNSKKILEGIKYPPFFTKALKCLETKNFYDFEKYVIELPLEVKRILMRYLINILKLNINTDLKKEYLQLYNEYKRIKINMAAGILKEYDLLYKTRIRINELLIQINNARDKVVVKKIEIILDSLEFLEIEKYVAKK